MMHDAEKNKAFQSIFHYVGLSDDLKIKMFRDAKINEIIRKALNECMLICKEREERKERTMTVEYREMMFRFLQKSNPGMFKFAKNGAIELSEEYQKKKDELGKTETLVANESTESNDDVDQSSDDENNDNKVTGVQSYLVSRMTRQNSIIFTLGFLFPILQMCLICGAPEGEPHFGGICCRACAAFFRRYFHSKKVSKKCTCKERTIKSHPCRKCRVEKCLKIGMTPEKIQGGRDRNTMDHLQMIPSGSCSPSSPPSLLTARIISRATSNLEFAYSNWKQFNRMRREVGGITYDMNIYDLTSLTKIDIELTWNMVISMFPSTRKLEESDKAALLRNFHMKFWMIVPIFDCIENPEFYENTKEEDHKNMMVEFYDGSFEKGKELTKKEIVRIFEPYWGSFYTKTVPPIVGLNLEKEELMAVLWLLFFDNGFINISSECLEMCRNIRKMILRELKNYQTDRNYDEMRFFDTVETLDIIEKGEQKFMEELLVCEMHNVRIHDDFKAILKENKY